MKERKYWLGLSVFPGIGPVTFKKLYTHFGSAKVIWHADVKEIAESGLSEKLIQKFTQFRGTFSILEYERELQRKKVKYITQTDAEYPVLLKQIKNPPIVLYVKKDSAQVAHENFLVRQRVGSSTINPNRSLANAHSENFVTSPRCIAVVGTRRITEYGKEVTQQFTQELVEHGFTIISGLAYGVDAVAHETTLQNNGKTIAVLGCGVDCCTPRENQQLYNSIVKTGGAIISELPLQHPPTKGSFPSRNRIVAGMSLGVVVTEGAEDSGALITADYAFKFGRKVFAVPGPITSNLSKGPYKLIKKGAKLVTSAQDIISELGITSSTSITGSTGRKIKVGTKEEEMILRLLENEALTFDEIVRRSKINSAKIGSLLSIMEIKGFIKSTGGSYSMV